MDGTEVALAQHEVRIAHLEDRLRNIEEKIDRLNWWLVVTAGGVAVAVIMLALDLAVRRL